MTDPIRIAVVGHTNTGKTSLLRTLLRDTRFGEVSDRPSTTRHVEGARLLADGTPILSLFDTPGMEDAIALLDYIDTLAPANARSDGPERIRRFLDSAEARARYEQEAKVLRQLLDSDAAFYVVDVRDPVLPKHRDELTLLADCARPILPVLNFVHAPESREAQWREAMARVGLHAQVRFDTVAPELGGERRLAVGAQGSRCRRCPRASCPGSAPLRDRGASSGRRRGRSPAARHSWPGRWGRWGAP